MKIYYAASVRIPGEKASSIQTIKMCEELGKLCSLTLLSPRVKHDALNVNIKKYYNVSQTFKIKHIFSLDLMEYAFNNLTDKITAYLNAKSFSFFLFFNLLFRKKDVIFARDYAYLIPFLVLKKLKLTNAKIIYEAHKISQFQAVNKLNRFLTTILESFVLKNSDKIITLTNITKNQIKKRYPEQTITTLPDGVNVKEFNMIYPKLECRKRINFPKNKKIILYTGYLYKWKGVDTLIKAAVYLPKDYSVALLGGFKSKKHAGGHKQDIDRINNLIKKLRIQDKIKLVGTVPYSQIPLYLKSSDVLVLPNTAKLEISRSHTSPLKMFEYMSSKKPIVASDIPSIREVLNNSNAILIKADDSKALYEGIKRAVKDKQLIKKITVQAYKDIQNYTWEKRAKKLLDFIK
jgi:glycosyltransferase involved in cell wall biosynthesis